MNLYKYLTNGGIVVPDTSDVKSEVEAELKSVFGDIDVKAETPAGRLVEMLTTIISTMAAVNAQNANQYNISQAVGSFLDSLGSNFNIHRLGAERSSVRVSLTGTANSVIPAGSIASMSSTGSKFYLSEDVTLDYDGNGTGIMLSEEFGEIRCGINELDTVESAVLGWTGVSNAAPANVGRNMETDFEFRRRIRSSRFFGTSFSKSIYSKLLSIPGVRSANVLDNGSGTAETISGVTISAHSIYVCIDGISDENKQAIGKAVFETKAAGCGYGEDTNTSYKVTIPVTDETFGNEYTVIVNRPHPVQVTVSVQYDDSEYAGSVDADDAIADVIERISGEMRIGDGISSVTIGNRIATEIPSIAVSSVTLTKGGTTSQYVTCSGNQLIELSMS